MKYCEFSFGTPAENLACDEALLELCEEGLEDEVLRFWQPSDYFVVLGYANRMSAEVNLEFCRQAAIPVLRRCTGGGTVLQGKGCLNYSLILQFDNRGEFHSIPTTNRCILERQAAALSDLAGTTIELKGSSDLAIGERKFSGNAQRRRKHCLIFHGTFLLSFDLAMIEKTLPMPSKQPDYRSNRSHSDFLTNLNVPAEAIKQTLRKSWNAAEEMKQAPDERVKTLVVDKYGRDDWNSRF